MSKPNKHKIPVPRQVHGKIPPGVARVKGFEDEESSNYRLSFDYYFDKDCEIEKLDATTARKCLDRLKNVGRSSYKNLKDLKPTPAQDVGVYKSLYKKLPEDADVYKIDFGASARLFYFVVENLFHIVLIKSVHFEDGKNKR